MKKFLVAIIFVIGLAAGAQAQQIIGTTKLTVTSTQASSQGLLSGCAYIGSGGCSLPAGWTVVAQQDFECSGSHAIPANPSCGNLPGSQGGDVGFNNTPNSFEQTQVHSGSYSFGGQYGSDGDQVGWFLNEGVTGSYSTIYFSWWEYTDPNALYGTSDYFMAGISGTTQCGGAGTGNGWNFQNPGVNTASSTSLLISGGNGGDDADGTTPNCQGQIIYPGGSKINMMAGSWRQVEASFTPNTTFAGTQAQIPGAVPCSSPSTPGCGNGNMQMYINGVKVGDQQNINMVGANSMTNGSISIGGVMTVFCSDGSRANPFSKCPAVAPTAFHRYFDDIIIIKR